MRILLVQIPELLEASLIESLARHHQPVVFSGDVRDLADCAAAANCDLIIHGLDAPANDVEQIDMATRGTWNLLTTTHARRYILLSSMRIFEQYGPGWHIDESWSPRPAAHAADLAPYLAEVASREISRIRPIECMMLRLDEIVSDQAIASGETWLHRDDAVAAITSAIDRGHSTSDGARWVPFHIVRGGPGSRYPATRRAKERLSFKAAHQGKAIQHWSPPAFPAPPAALHDLPQPERILILGAGGPIGAAATEVLKKDHRLRLAGRRSMAEVAAAPPQSEGAPLPQTPEPPHEEHSVDISDSQAVRNAASDMDAIINLTVLRPDPVEAFRVNTLGAYHVMQAALYHRIQRVVHTGPILTLGPHPAGYIEDRDIGSDVPPRPGDNLYFVSKFLGQEICRVFAEQHGIACPTLLYCGFVDPDTAARQRRTPHPFTISWEDSGRSLAAAARVKALSRPFEVFHILADSPHDRYRNDKAGALLGWEPLDRLDSFWYRQDMEPA